MWAVHLECPGVLRECGYGQGLYKTQTQKIGFGWFFLEAAYSGPGASAKDLFGPWDALHSRSGRADRGAANDAKPGVSDPGNPHWHWKAASGLVSGPWGKERWGWTGALPYQDQCSAKAVARWKGDACWAFLSWRFPMVLDAAWGATQPFCSSNNLPHVGMVGRWNCQKTARIYITDALAQLAEIAAPTPVRQSWLLFSPQSTAKLHIWLVAPPFCFFFPPFWETVAKFVSGILAQGLAIWLPSCPQKHYENLTATDWVRTKELFFFILSFVFFVFLFHIILPSCEIFIFFILQSCARVMFIFSFCDHVNLSLSFFSFSHHVTLSLSHSFCINSPVRWNAPL